MGTWAALASYVMWGLFPVFWKQIEYIDPVHILCHRILWSAVFFLAAVFACGMAGRLWSILRQGKAALGAALSGALISANWGIYIWAVNTGHVTDASLAYYVTPLLSVATGRLFFREKMDGWTAASVTLAALGIGAATAMAGAPPWGAVFMVATFSIYTALKKWAGLEALAGMAAETVLVAPLALAWLLRGHSMGGGELPHGFFGTDPKSAAFLIIGGPVTALPLLSFAYANIRIPLQRMGFIQYLSPTATMTIGLFMYGETLGPPMRVAFATVLCAVALYLGTRGTRVAARAGEGPSPG